MGDDKGTVIGLMKGDSRSSGCSSYNCPFYDACHVRAFLPSFPTNEQHAFGDMLMRPK